MDLEGKMRISVHTCVSFTLCEKLKVKSLSRVQLFLTLWVVAYQAPPSRVRTWVSCTADRHFISLSHQGSPEFLLCVRTLIIYILQMRKLRSREINQFKVRWLLSEGVIPHPTLSTAYIQNHYFTTNVSSLRQFLQILFCLT